MRYIYLILLLAFQSNCGSDSSSQTLDNIYGCTDPLYCNYNPNANTEEIPSTCWMPNQGCVCGDGEDAISDDNGICCSSNLIDCNNNCNGFASIDDCQVCSGGNTGIVVNECSSSLPENTIGFYPKNDNNQYGTIVYNISNDIGGFQFNITNINFTPFNGSSELVDAPSNYMQGGNVQMYDFACYSSVQDGGDSIDDPETFLICYSFGDYIESGHGILTYIHYDNDFNQSNDQISITNIVFANQLGDNFDVNFYNTCENALYDCSGICDGNTILDECGECGGDGIDENACDCDDNIYDCSGVCNGPDDLCYDCNGEPNGTAYIDSCDYCVGGTTGLVDCLYECDDCDVCDNDPTNNCVVDCLGVENGDAVLDECGVCDGNGVDQDNDGICDDIDICVGEYDACEVCNGDGSSCNCTAVVCLTLDGQNLLYTSSEDIYGFQFAHSNCATTPTIGDAITNNFSISSNSAVVFGFSFAGDFIPSGSGILVDGVNSCETIHGLVMSGAAGANLTVELNE